MDRKARTLAQLLAVALMIMTGVGLYTFSLLDRLDDTQESFGALERDRNQWKSKAEAAESLIDGASASLNQCSAQVDALKSRLAVSVPEPRDPRS
jgi:Tfp pilus assembly protein PilO